MTTFMQRAKEWLVGTPEAGLPDPAAIHITQVPDELTNPNAPAYTADCGPTTVIMAIRALGLAVPGEERGLRGQQLVDHVRRLATGSVDTHTGTTNLHLQRVLATAGASWRILTHPKDMLTAVRNGEPVIMAGNPTNRGAYPQRFDYFEVRRWDGGHWILVNRYNPERRTYTVNDPQSIIGPIEATEAELFAFNGRDGDFGIAVRRGH